MSPASPSPWIIDVAEADFEKEVIERSHEVPIVVDFWAEWCGPCRTLGPVLERLAAEANGRFVLAKVDVDRAPSLSVAFAVQAIPAVKAFRGGKLVDGFVGVLPEPQIRQFLDKLGPSEAEQTVARAREDEERDPSRAESSYRKALELDPHLDSARVGLARVLLRQGKESEAQEVIENLVPAGDLADEVERLKATVEVRRLAAACPDLETALRRADAEPENAQARYELGCALAAAGDHAEALEALTRAAELDRTLAKEKVRELMVRIFYLIGARSPLANEYRRRLSRLLY